MKIIESEIKKEGWEVKKVCEKCKEITQIKKIKEFEWFCQPCSCAMKKVKMREEMLGKQTNIFHFLDS